MAMDIGKKMKNESLVKDYINRSAARIKALQTLFDEKSWSDVVRESQEVVELLLKALLRKNLIDPPRIHDVSEVLLQEEAKFSSSLKKEIQKLAKISRQLRRDRELAFYGSEDLTPSDFYKKEDAEEALKSAKWVFEIVKKNCN